MFLNFVKSLIVAVEDRGTNVKNNASDLYHFVTEKEKREAFRQEKGKPVVKALPTETKKVTCSVVAKNEPRQWKTIAAEQPVQQPVVESGFLTPVNTTSSRFTPRSWSEQYDNETVEQLNAHLPMPKEQQPEIVTVVPEPNNCDLNLWKSAFLVEKTQPTENN